MCDRFEMGRVDATAVAAEMVELKTIRHRTDEMLIGPAMRLDICGTPFPISTVDRERAIATAAFSAAPGPAAVVAVVDDDEVPEALFSWRRVAHLAALCFRR